MHLLWCPIVGLVWTVESHDLIVSMEISSYHVMALLLKLSVFNSKCISTLLWSADVITSGKNC